MNDERISIEGHYNPNPHRQRTFTLDFFDDHKIHVTLTSTHSVVRTWVYTTLRRLLLTERERLIIGLGVQRRPSSTYAATLQLCVRDSCLIFHLRHASHVPGALRRFLSHPNNTFVGVWNHYDREKLMNSRHNLSVSKLVDIRDVVEEEMGWSRGLSMEKLAGRFLGFKDVKKPEWIGRSDWDAYWLSKEQVQYASVDAFLSFLMGTTLYFWSDWEG